MDYYPNVIKIYVQKKTVEKYETLEEFHNDLSKLNYKFAYEAVHDYPKTLSKMNEVDFTFVICKLIDEGEYLSAYELVSANIRYSNQQIQLKFAEHIKNHPQKFDTTITNYNLKKSIENNLIANSEESDVLIPFECLLIDAPLYNHEIVFSKHFDDLGKIIDLDKIIFYHQYGNDNTAESYIDAIFHSKYFNQYWVISTLIKKDVIIDIEMLSLVTIYRDKSNEQETEIYNKLSDKILGISNLKKENQELRDKNIDLEKKLNELKELL